MKWNLAFTFFYLALIFCSWWGYKNKWQFNYPSSNLYSTFGLDVSHHQGKIDWSEVPTEKFKFVYIKASEGISFQDKKFSQNYKEAKKAGLAVGGYHFWSICKDPHAQLKNIQETIPNNKGDLVPAIDIETVKGCDEKGKTFDLFDQVWTINKFFLKHYKALPLIYTTKEFSKAHPGVLEHENVYWIRSLLGPPRVNYWDIWQYYNRGKVKGFSGFVDLNVLRSELKLQGISLP